MRQACSLSSRVCVIVCELALSSCCCAVRIAGIRRSASERARRYVRYVNAPKWFKPKVRYIQCTRNAVHGKQPCPEQPSLAAHWSNKSAHQPQRVCVCVVRTVTVNAAHLPAVALSAPARIHKQQRTCERTYHCIIIKHTHTHE